VRRTPCCRQLGRSSSPAQKSKRSRSSWAAFFCALDVPERMSAKDKSPIHENYLICNLMETLLNLDYPSVWKASSLVPDKNGGERRVPNNGLLCVWLEAQCGYIFRSWNAAWNHVMQQCPPPPRLSAKGRQITTRGPCIGRGYHRNVYRGHEYVAAIVQCPCTGLNGQTSERLRVI
jgi:hypothetical protein